MRYQLIDLARGTRSMALLRRLRASQFAGPEQLKADNEVVLRDYFAELQRATPLFAQATCFEELPVLDKDFIRTHRDELMNPGYRGRMVRKKTGGSTGEPLVYFTSSEAQSYLWAGIFLAWEAAGWKLGERVAFLSGSSLVGGTGWKQALYYALLRIQLLSAFDLSEAAMRSHVSAIERGGARLLYGYASAIHRVAVWLLQQGLQIRSTLRAVVCTSEVLTSGMRMDIEAAFGVPCFNQYGCNDAGVSAFECEQRNGLHVIHPRCHLEVLPDGRMLSTDLANRAMFMPRYETGDRIRMSGRKCGCGRGFPLIDEVLGRQNDIVMDPCGTVVHPEFFTHMFREDVRIRAFQVQFDEWALYVNLHLTAGADREAITHRYQAIIAKRLTFRQMKFIFDEPFVSQPNDKHRFIMRRTDDNAPVTGTL